MSEITHAWVNEFHPAPRDWFSLSAPNVERPLKRWALVHAPLCAANFAFFVFNASWFNLAAAALSWWCMWQNLRRLEDIRRWEANIEAVLRVEIAKMEEKGFYFGMDFGVDGGSYAVRHFFENGELKMERVH